MDEFVLHCLASFAGHHSSVAIKEGQMRRSSSILFHSRQAALQTLLLAFALSPVVLFAQAYFGTVSGELTDATGAVVQGARVVLTDQQKGFTFYTTSDTSGRYLFRSIPPGPYVVSVEAQGFGKTQSARFKVDINENATGNLTLKVVGATQTVTVEAAAQAIQTE